MDWHPATLSRRRDTFYVVMTVPQEARAALGGQSQVRASTKTTDRGIANKRRHDLEAQLRAKVAAAVQQKELCSVASAYQQAVRRLGLRNQPYTVEYHPADGGVAERFMAHPPRNAREVGDAERAFETRLLELKSAELHQDSAEFLRLMELCGDTVPGHDEARELAGWALAEAKRGVGLPADAGPTLLSFLPTLDDHNTRRVSQGSMKLRTAKARAKNIRHFVGCVGDVALSDLRPIHAYEYAESMAADFGNSTIKTRISDVSSLLRYAVAKGLIDQNPFTGLDLSTYGTRTEHYTPLSDELLFRLFSVPNLPDTVRWIWAILVCTGMRLDEVATLRADQIKVSDGVRHFDLRNANVKNKSAQRRVPICATLEPLVQHLLQDKSGRQQLFAFKLNADGKTRASAVCTYWMQKAKLNETSGDMQGRYTTHSLRGTLKDKMRDARVSSEVHNALLGHDQTTVSASYGRGPGLPLMKEAVDLARHPYLSWIASVGERSRNEAALPTTAAPQDATNCLPPGR